MNIDFKLYFEYLGRTEHGEDAVFTPNPINPDTGRPFVDPFTWDTGTWKGAGKWYLDNVKCKLCGKVFRGRTNDGHGAFVFGMPSISEKVHEHYNKHFKRLG